MDAAAAALELLAHRDRPDRTAKTARMVPQVPTERPATTPSPEINQRRPNHASTAPKRPPVHPARPVHQAAPVKRDPLAMTPMVPHAAHQAQLVHPAHPAALAPQDPRDPTEPPARPPTSLALRAPTVHLVPQVPLVKTEEQERQATQEPQAAPDLREMPANLDRPARMVHRVRRVHLETVVAPAAATTAHRPARHLATKRRHSSTRNNASFSAFFISSTLFCTCSFKLVHLSLQSYIALALRPETSVSFVFMNTVVGWRSILLDANHATNIYFQRH